METYKCSKKSSIYIAHIADDGQEQTVEEHLSGSAALCKQFASSL